MLFTDGPISTVDQLADYESEIRQVAAGESINLDTKLRLAQTEIGVELLATAVAPDGWNGYWITPGFVRNKFTLAQVVITDALQLWHIFATLGAVYRDAYNRKLNDKYLPKWNEYQDLARTAENQCMTMGLGVVYAPLPAPGAPQLTAVAGGTLGASNYFVQTTWVNAAGQESYPSPEAGLAVAAAHLLQVQPTPPPANATGWIAYVTMVSGQEQKQFYTPLNPYYAWTLPPTGLVAGPAPGNGQPYDILRTVPRTLQRG
jgi:hypothetical protein